LKTNDSCLRENFLKKKKVKKPDHFFRNLVRTRIKKNFEKKKRNAQHWFKPNVGSLSVPKFPIFWLK
jgi:hypothetical protein